jgi:hypothetical protein
MSPVSYPVECFLQEGFKTDSLRIMKDIQNSAGGCQVTFFSKLTTFDCGSRITHNSLHLGYVSKSDVGILDVGTW